MSSVGGLNLGRRDKLALFIDGANLHYAAKALGFDVDYKRLLEEFQRRGDVLRAFYYTTVNESADHVAVRPLIDWLSYHGFTVRAKPAKVGRWGWSTRPDDRCDGNHAACRPGRSIYW